MIFITGCLSVKMKKLKAINSTSISYVPLYTGTPQANCSHYLSKHINFKWLTGWIILVALDDNGDTLHAYFYHYLVVNKDKKIVDITARKSNSVQYKFVVDDRPYPKHENFLVKQGKLITDWTCENDVISYAEQK